jgi:hypothetical protein
MMLYIWEWKRWKGLSLKNILISLSNFKVFAANIQVALALMKAQSTEA